MKLLFLFLFSLFAFVSSLPLFVRDVYAPPVLYPNTHTVWVVGQKHKVVWDTSNPPQQITNPIGQIYLRTEDHTMLDRPLALNFNIMKGHTEVTVPAVKPGLYRIVLFGDSGNFSPEFRIVSYKDSASSDDNSE
ncbi:hypothetical protein APHAL10511_004911 [Amanita phalloides]|nr:hypothetical protein APHAL10511_004911 [Amanita phalloides]